MKFIEEIKCPHCGAVDITTGINLNSFAKRKEETYGYCYECLKEFKISYEAVRRDLISQDAVLLEYSITAMARPDRFRTVTRSYDPVTGSYETAVSEYCVTNIVIIEDYPDKHY